MWTAQVRCLFGGPIKWKLVTACYETDTSLLMIYDALQCMICILSGIYVYPGPCTHKYVNVWPYLCVRADRHFVLPARLNRMHAALEGILLRLCGDKLQVRRASTALLGFFLLWMYRNPACLHLYGVRGCWYCPHPAATAAIRSAVSLASRSALALDLVQQFSQQYVRLPSH